MPRVLLDTLVSGSALLILFAVLVSADPRVRTRVTSAAQSAMSPSAAVTAGTQVKYVASAVFDAARDRSIDHAPLLLFSAAGLLLFVFMLRT